MQIAPPPDITLEDYAAIEEAVMESARGRWFLIEFARRQREIETNRLADVASQLENLLFRLTQSPSEISSQLNSQNPPPARNDGFDEAAPRGARAITEKISDIVWSMRERGLDNLWCGQLMEQVQALRALPEEGFAPPHAAGEFLSLHAAPHAPAAMEIHGLDKRPLRRPPPHPTASAQKPGLARLDALSTHDKLALFC